MAYQEQKKDKKRYVSWANGFNYRGKQIYHDYLEIGFKFDSEINK
jgi:hypothetical protein